jgi:hypothetical protein
MAASNRVIKICFRLIMQEYLKADYIYENVSNASFAAVDVIAEFTSV